MKSVSKCINAIKATAICEYLINQCWKNKMHTMRLILHNEVRWLSKENCLKIFMKLFDVLRDFLGDKHEMKHLLTMDGKAFVSYLADIHEKQP